jgi:hypothetical protein
MPDDNESISRTLQANLLNGLDSYVTYGLTSVALIVVALVAEALNLSWRERAMFIAISVLLAFFASACIVGWQRAKTEDAKNRYTNLLREEQIRLLRSTDHKENSALQSAAVRTIVEVQQASATPQWPLVGGVASPIVRDTIATESKPATIELKWGGKIPMVFKGINRSTTMLPNVKCILINADRWSPSNKDFATTSETHQGGLFSQIEIGKNDLHCDEPVKFGFIHYQIHRLEIHGNPLNALDHWRVTKGGIYRLHLSLKESSGKTTDFALCLKWDGPDTEPVALDTCPVPGQDYEFRKV